MKKLSLITLIVTAALISHSTIAETLDSNNGEITFSGRVLPNTCTVTGSSNGAISVSLGDIKKSDLVLVNTAASGTDFSIDLTGCDEGTVKAVLSADTNNQDGSDLKNTATTDAATGVVVQVFDGSNLINFSTPANNVTTPKPITSDGTASFPYKARIAAKTGETPTIGNVVAKAKYTIQYEVGQ